MIEITPPIASPPTPGPIRLSGTRRAVASVLLTVGLFALGGTAVAMAADPSASPAPPTQPNGGSGAPSGNPNHANRQGCPNMGGSGGSQGTPNAPGAPAAPGSSATPSV